MSLGRSMSVRERLRGQAERDAVVLAVKKELAAAVEYEAGDPDLPRAVAALAGKGRVAGVDYEVRELPSRQCILLLPVGHRSIDLMTRP